MSGSEPQNSFLKKLAEEIPLWARLGFIEKEQGDRILDYYRKTEAATNDKQVAPPATGPHRGSVSARLPQILIGVAVLLIGTGILLFYAANWRKMPPNWKLVQVALLLLGTYGAAFYFLLVERKRILVGRGLLLIAMISYGAAIGLVAQIFHISSHPVNGLLLWLAGTLAISLVMEERWGYYLALLQGFVWNAWRYFQYDDPNYAFVLLPALLGFMFYRKRDGIGLVLCVAQFLFWFYQINFYWLARHAAGDTEIDSRAILFVLMHIPLGLIFVLGQRLRWSADFLRLPLVLVNFFGWLFVFGPLLALSWPFDLGFQSFLENFTATRIFLAEYALLIAAAAGLVFRVYRRGGNYRFPAACGLFALALPLLPLGHKTTLLIVTHLGILGFIAGALYFAYRESTPTAERLLAILLTVAALGVKGLGFFIFGVAVQYEFYIAYCLGFVIFATVVFLINQFVRHAVAADFPHWILSAVISFFVYWILYALSFQIKDQHSIFTASAVVLTLLVLFTALAIALFALLALKGSERLPLYLSGLVFGASLIVLISAGPEVPWQFYSVVFNLLLFIMIGVLIYYSTVVNSVLLANLALAGLVLQIVTRYFDLFWDLLSGSTLFIVTGILIFGGGYLLERHRSRLIAKIESREERV